jgi:hypothetical protein
LSVFISQFDIENSSPSEQPTYIFQILFKEFLLEKKDADIINSDLGIKLSLVTAICLSNFYQSRIVERDKDIFPDVDLEEHGKVKNAGDQQLSICL